MSRVAPFYTYPGCNKPNGTGECIVAHACAAEANFALAEMERLNALALAALSKDHGVKLAAFPGDLVAAARQQAGDVLGELSARNAIPAKVHTSYTEFRERTAPWSRISIEAVLRTRGA
jgi:TRAP-type mannitol/chloroaromatic compound transport system substrate-binding protein